MTSESKIVRFKNTGVSAATLLELVQNTTPFLFDGTATDFEVDHFRYVKILHDARGNEAEIDQDLVRYYELCLASHFATVGTFVPTDVDLAIRSKLWKHVHNEGAFLALWKLIEEFLTWDESLVSRRVVKTGKGLKLSGHQGEWFTIAMAAYGAARKVVPQYLGDVREAIEKEFSLQETALQELKDAFHFDPTLENGKNYAAGVAAIAHNLGDLDRMFDLWEIDDEDILKKRVFRAGHEDARKQRPVFLEAGKIYEKMLASENHRHFALREAKPLRMSPEFLLTYAPFLDEWGSRIVEAGYQGGVLTERDFREILEALIVGWKKLNAHSIYASQGYARALCGMAKSSKVKLTELLPPNLAKELSESGLRTLMSVPKAEYEKKWIRKLLTELSSPSESIE